MIRAARHKKIKSLLKDEGVVSIADLAETCETSAVTIRRDLGVLEDQGQLLRTYGGAIALIAPDTIMPPYDVRAREYTDVKLSITKLAAKYIENGDNLIISAGTTMHALALQLKHHKNLKVVTNGLAVAMEIVESQDSRVLMIGGAVDSKELATVGQLAEETIRDIHATKAFLSVFAVSIENGISVHSPVEAEINRRFVESANEITVVADSSKFESPSSNMFDVNFMFKVADLSEINRIVTDSDIDRQLKKKLEKLGLEVIIAELG